VYTELLQALLTASSNKALMSITSAQETLMGVPSRLLRLVEPPPQGGAHADARVMRVWFACACVEAPYPPPTTTFLPDSALCMPDSALCMPDSPLCMPRPGFPPGRKPGCRPAALACLTPNPLRGPC
jgi:hypothetical protein